MYGTYTMPAIAQIPVATVKTATIPNMYSMSWMNAVPIIPTARVIRMKFLKDFFMLMGFEGVNVLFELAMRGERETIGKDVRRQVETIQGKNIQRSWQRDSNPQLLQQLSMHGLSLGTC
jgi:hypothetical protein